MKFLICALLCFVICFCRSISNISEPSTSAHNYLPSAESVKILSLGFDDLLADAYWLAFVQYLGANSNSTQAEQYLQTIITLDPHFLKAYYFIAFIVGSEQRRSDDAAKLIQFGIDSNPYSWNLPFLAGVNQFLYAHNEVAAAKYYRMAARFPDAPAWLERQAKILEAKIPSKIKEINVWDSIYRSASDAPVRARARVKLIALWTQVYETSPTKEIKNRARNQLNQLSD